MPKTMPAADLLLSPALEQAPLLDLMCSQLVLSLAARPGSQFNLRRELLALMGLTGRHLVWPAPVLARLRSFLQRRCQDNEAWRGQQALDGPAFLQRHGVWRGPYEEGTLFFHLDEYAKDAPKDVLTLLSCTSAWLAQKLKRQATLVEKNIDALGGLLQLNRAERALLLYGTLARYQRDLRSLLVEFKVSHAAEAYAAIAELAGVDANEVGEALRAGSRLERIGLVEHLIAEHSVTDLSDLMKVSEKLPPVLMRAYRDQAELMAVFTRPASTSSLGPADFDFVREDVQVLVKLLAHAVRERQAGVNVLLYGPPGTGKTELAKVLAQAAAVNLFEVEYADRDGNSLSGRDRYRSLQIGQAFLKGTAQAVLLFDEVEDVFPPISVDAAGLLARQEQQALGAAVSHSVNGKAWVNQILEANPVPTLWVTNRVEQIDPAFRRRFAYHLELSSPPPGAREQMLRKALAGLAVDAAFIDRLGARQGLTPAQIGTALRFAKLVQGGVAASDDSVAAASELQALVERQLGNADAALGHKPSSTSNAPAPVTQYDLAMLNVQSRYEIPRIVQALAARGHGTLCFYGPPGSGKTALAQHIADVLGRPLLAKQASDLMSKYVGETEQNLAAMFKQAQAERAVLLLDEADSYLQDRRGAQRSYEVSEVNEMLQGMERFAGIFICTTNLLDRIDQAALRRFTFKIEFRPLTTEQRQQMFITEALAGAAAALDGALAERLARLTQLCPGDFAAVKRQVDILGETLGPEEFLDQLEVEHRLKPEVRETRSIGFR